MITNTASFDGAQSLVALVHNRLISVRLKLSTSNSSSAQCTHPLCAIVHNRHVRVRLKYSSCEPTSLQCSDDTQPLFASVHNRPVLVRLKLSKVEPTSAELSAFILHGRNGSVTALATAETEAANAKAKLQHKMRGLNTIGGGDSQSLAGISMVVRRHLTERLRRSHTHIINSNSKSQLQTNSRSQISFSQSQGAPPNLRSKGL